MNYVLNAQPRKEYMVLHSDLGRLFHDVITGFIARLAAGDIP
jgi:ATP-dependent helicase/DNAse subunit B